MKCVNGDEACLQTFIFILSLSGTYPMNLVGAESPIVRRKSKANVFADNEIKTHVLHGINVIIYTNDISDKCWLPW